MLEANLEANLESQRQLKKSRGQGQDAKSKEAYAINIMVCDTISAVRSWTLLKVLLDSGSTAMFIPRKGLPRHCKPCPVTKTDSVNMLAGLFSDNQMVVLRAIQLPELDKNESSSSIKHLCSMVILGLT